jgi:bla regulator protein blaR1
MEGFSEFACRFAGLALCAAVSSLPLCVIVGAITLVGQRTLSARMRFALWSLVLIRMILPVSLETPFGLGMLTNHLPDSTSTPVLSAKDLSREMSLPDVGEPLHEFLYATPATVPTTWRWDHWVEDMAMFGMTGVSLLLACWFLVTSIRTSRRIRRGVAPEHRTWTELLNQGRRQFGIRVAVELRTLRQWTTPATMGYFRPIIILPDDAASLSETEVRHVLWHELAHIKRGDAAWSYLWIVARCLQWWNPCFWWTQRCWLAERELACDALVMQHLGSSAGPEYGRTLIHFLERLSQSSISSPSLPLPGLVMLLGDKGTIRRRLKAVAHPLAIETVWGRWCSVGLLTLLAVMGLTDAATSKTESPPLHAVTVPSGTVWQFGTESTDNVEAVPLPATTRVYNIRAALARIQQVEPQADSEIFIRRMIQDDRTIFPWINGKPQTEQCQIRGDELIVHATEPQQQMIQKLLSHWQQFGRQQIATEVRLISTDKELSDFLPAAGGQIISPSPLREMNLIKPLKPAHEISNLLSGPSYIRVLSRDERATALQWLQNDPGSDLLCVPKVTMFSLSFANVALGTERPFVTGLRTREDGTREPQVSKVMEGVQMKLAAKVVDAQGAVQLDLHIRDSRILDVEAFWTKVAHQADEIGIQIPHVTESNLKTSVTLARDESILISPLRRDKQGKLQVFLITANAIEAP